MLDYELPEECHGAETDWDAVLEQVIEAVPGMRRASRRDRTLASRRHPVTSDDTFESYDKHGGKHGRER
jgi:hypothetical protein